ncbi:MAG: hypothetical protein J0J04_07805 [Microbacterium sp.]|nr:hypothetical protein [Microbacterium sp.]MBN9214703.1 hypothetical protein [Microbacterium sp.]
MPSLFGHRYVDRSAEHAATREKERQKKVASWERMKAQVAAKHAAIDA